MDNPKLKLLSGKLRSEIAAHPSFTILTDDDDAPKDPVIISKTLTKKINFTLPKNFNGAEVWKEYIRPIVNQGKCGSCWAYSSTGMLGARFGIQSKGKLKANLSPERLILCGGNFDEIDIEFEKLRIRDAKQYEILQNYGCSGNTLLNAFNYLFLVGTVLEKCVNKKLGSNFFTTLNDNTEDTINNIPLCSDVTGIFQDLCQNNFQNRVTGFETGDASRFYRCVIYYAIPENVREIMIEIYKWGPISSAYTLYADFYEFDFSEDSEHGGIYEYDGVSPKISGHAIQIVGWGVWKGKEYWWVENSWGVDWGINGLFKILKGANMCGIESNCYGALPDYFYEYETFDQFFDNTGSTFSIEDKEFWKNILKKNNKLNTIIDDSGFGGSDFMSGFSNRILETRPWINNARIIDLKDLPDFSTFVAGTDSNSIEKYCAPKRRSSIPQYLLIIVLGILLISITVLALVIHYRL